MFNILCPDFIKTGYGWTIYHLCDPFRASNWLLCGTYNRLNMNNEVYKFLHEFLVTNREL